MSTLTDTDPAKTAALSERVLGWLNGGALCLMTSLGHRLGLFDAMAGLPASTSPAIAEAAGLEERYVREWLGAMVTGGVVEYDPGTRGYRLPPEHAACLTRAAAPNNLAAFAQYLAVLGGVEDEVLACFRRGGGVPYESFRRFHEVMAEDSGQTVLPALFDHILPLVPGLSQRLARGIDVLDLGCGQARALLLLAARFPRSRFVGYDLSEEALAPAREEARRQGLSNLRLEARDAAGLDEESRYDLVLTFDAVHDQADPDGVLRNIHRALRPDGVYLMQDIRASSELEENLEHPLGPWLYTISTMHCMTVSLAAGGAGLGTCWGHQRARDMLRAAGFASFERHGLAHDLQNDYWVVRKA